jgi:cytochrome c oxidase assembly protein subunit 15
MSLELSRNASEPAATLARRCAHFMALGAAVFTLPLLYVGGSVTTYRVGLAVPDWPTTFGINMFLFNMWDHPFGVRVEHTHRLYGAAVGLFTLILAGWLLVFEPRKWLKGLGLVALATVIVQGILGGTRVTQTSTLLAAVHACVGQAFFAMMVALCVFTGRRWQTASDQRIEATWIRPLGWALLALVPGQIVLGSWLRHYGTGAALAAHVVLATAVLGSCLFLGFIVEQHKASWRPLVRSARALAVISTLQVALGIGAFLSVLPFDGIPRPVSFYQAVTRTAHQSSGALLLAAAVVFNLRCLAHVAGKPFSSRSTAGAMAFSEAATVALERGAMA